MDVAPQMIFGKVMHRRLFPKVNAFVYPVYYLCLPLSKLADVSDGWRMGVNKPALVSYQDRDHGARDGSPAESWARGLLAKHDVAATGEIILVTMPRVLGHVFNPVSFFLCHDAAGTMKAVICEVNNTFGETHTYICAPDGAVIERENVLSAGKEFHVSPFLPREGHYRFRFDVQESQLGIFIDYYAADGRKQLETAVTGKRVAMTRATRRRAFWRYPAVALMAVARIHWQAIKLLAKGIKYVPKPLQLGHKTSQAKPLPFTPHDSEADHVH